MSILGFTSRYILIHLQRIWSHLLFLPCWNIQNLLYEYANIFAYFLLHRPVFISINAWKASCFHIMHSQLVPVSAQAVNPTFSCYNAHFDIHPCLNYESWKPPVSQPTWFIILCPFHCDWLAMSSPNQAGPVCLLVFLRIKICHYLMYPCDSPRPPSSAERRSQKPRSSRKRGRSWPLQRGSWNRRAARPQLGRRSSGMMRCVKCSWASNNYQ